MEILERKINLLKQPRVRGRFPQLQCDDCATILIAFSYKRRQFKIFMWQTLPLKTNYCKSEKTRFVNEQKIIETSLEDFLTVTENDAGIFLQEIPKFRIK